MVLMEVIVSVSLFRISALNEEMNDLINDKIPKTFQCDSIINNVNVIARSIRNILIEDRTEMKQQEHERIVESTGVSKDITEDIEKLEESSRQRKIRICLKNDRGPCSLSPRSEGGRNPCRKQEGDVKRRRS